MERVTIDPTRMAQGIMTGIGFLPENLRQLSETLVKIPAVQEFRISPTGD
jgi:hypothetical protein